MTTPDADLKTVLEVGGGLRWVAIDSPQAGNLAGRLNETAIGGFVGGDARGERLGVTRRYYGLTEASGEPLSMPVCLVVDSGRETGPFSGTLVTGFRNANPFPAYAAEVAALGTHLGVDLGPERYPYSRSYPSLARVMIGSADLLQVRGAIRRHLPDADLARLAGDPAGVAAIDMLKPAQSDAVDWPALLGELRDLTGVEVMGLGDTNGELANGSVAHVTAFAFDVPDLEPHFAALADHRIHPANQGPR